MCSQTSCADEHFAATRLGIRYIGVRGGRGPVRGRDLDFSGDIKRFKKLKEVYLDTGKERKLLHVVSCKFVKNQPVLRFKEFSNINEVEMYKRKGLFVTRDQAVPLEKDEYFIADLIGLSVIREDNGEVLGELTDVLQTGANDVYEVKMEDGKEVLLPAIRECIKNVDLQKGEITVHVMKGLLDE
mgnify:CR=1 FL=1